MNRNPLVGSGLKPGPNPLLALSLSLCMLLGPVASGMTTASAIAADAAKSADHQSSTNSGDTTSATAGSLDAPSGDLTGSGSTPATSASDGATPGTAGDTASTGVTEKSTKSKKKTSSRSTSSRSPSRSKKKESEAAAETKTETSADPTAQSLEQKPEDKPTTGSNTSPSGGTSSTTTDGDTSSTTPSADSKPAGSEEKKAEDKPTKAEKPVKASRKSKKSKTKNSDSATTSGASDETATDKTSSPSAEQPAEVSPPSGDQPQPKEATGDRVAPPTGSTATNNDKADSTDSMDAADLPDIKKTPPKKVEDTGNDEGPAPVKRKRASSLAEADELLLKNKFEAAEESYRGLIGADDTGDAHAGLAVALAKQMWPKKVIEAEKIMKKGKEQFADNPNIKAAGSFVSYVHSKSVASPAKRDLYLEAAESLAKRAIKDDPGTVIAQQTLGLVKLAQDDPEGAIPPLRKAAKMAGDPFTNSLLAEALLKVDPHDEDAKALIDDALAQDKNYHPARIQKAIYLTNKGKHEEGFTELLSIPRDQRGSDWYRVQGDIYKVQGDGPSALGSWKEANRLDPRNPEPYKNLAHYYSARGDGELAIAEMHNALEILPNDMRLRGELAELALRQDKLEVAETEYRTILGAKDNDPQSLLGLSRVYFRKARKEGQYPSGWSELLDKVQRVVTEQSVQGNLVKSGAKNLTEKIQLSEAEKALSENPPRFRHARQLFSQVITTHREEPYELLSLGEQAFNDGDLKSAEEAYGYAKEINEVAPRAEQGISKIVSQRNEAKRHTELGNATWKLPEIAIDHYRQALIADPQHPDAYYGLYKLYFRTKKDDTKAIDYANNFLEASEDSDPLRKEVEDDLFRLKKRDRK